MKKKIFLFSAFLLSLIMFSFNIYAQQGWGFRNPQPQGSVYQLDFLNINTGFGVCDKGLIIKTTNGGSTWLFFRSGTGKNLYSLYFFDLNSGYAVGDSGTIIFTSNAGTNWITRNSGVTEPLNSITFVNLNTGFAAGGSGKVLKTTNSGLNWQTQTIGTNQLNKVFFLNTNTGYIASSGGLFAKTTNSGVNWVSSIIDTFAIRSVFFTGVDTGYIAGSNGIFKTVNGGINWYNIYSLQWNQDMYCVKFINSDTGYCVGKNAPILKTTNAGSNWMIDITGVYQPYTYFNISKIDTILYISGTEGYILKSSPNAMWYTIGGTRHNVNSLAIVNSNIILGCADNQTMFSTNSGNNWTIDTYGQNNFFEPISWRFKLLRFSSPNNIYRVTYIGGGGTGGYNESASRSTDGGLSWIGINGLSFPFNYIHDISVVDNSVYAVRSVFGYNYIIKSTAGGDWVILFSGNSLTFSKLSFYDMNTGVVEGNDYNNSTNVILKTNNGGVNWTTYNIPTNISGKIQMLSTDNAVIMNYNGSIYRTTDGGAGWFVQDSITLGNINDFYFANINTGWIVGSSGMILHTSNSGYNWDQQISRTSYNLLCLSFMDELNGVVGGDSGIILKTTNGGITFVNITGDPVANSYSLKQNYPNPFNPVTKIRFDIPLDSRLRRNDNVTLKIYDILGREIAVLVNERLNPGTYEVEWDASNYPSGVYFYKLISSEFTDTKKMVLLK